MRLMDVCQSMVEAKTVDDLNTRIMQAAESLSCKYFSGFLVKFPTSKCENGEYRSFGQPPKSFTGHSNASAAKRDPVLARCRNSPGLPYMWKRADYEDAGHGDLWEEMAEHGMQRGLLAFTALPDNRWYGFGIESDVSQVPSPNEMTMHLGGFALLTAYSRVAVESIIGWPEQPVVANPLSPRQREVLQWTSQGKTAWEVGQIMSISTSTVNQHIHAVMQQLHVNNKAAAAAVALKAGWI